MSNINVDGSKTITIYFTLNSFLVDRNKTKNKYKEVWKPEFNQINEMQKDLVFENNIRTRLNNLRKKKFIQTVLILPFDKEYAEKYITNLYYLTFPFDRVYYGYQTGEYPGVIVPIEDITDELEELGLPYQVANSKSDSPIIEVLGEEELLNNVYDKLLEDKIIYSGDISQCWGTDKHLLKLFKNDKYRDLISKDVAMHKDLDNFTILAGTEYWELDLASSVDSFITGEDVVYRLVEDKGFNPNSELINSVKVIPTENSPNFNALLLDEINIFINKIYN